MQTHIEGVHLQLSAFVRITESLAGEKAFRLLGSLEAGSARETLVTSIFLVQFEFDAIACDSTYLVVLKFIDPEGQMLKEVTYEEFTPQIVPNEGFGVAGDAMSLDDCILPSRGTYNGQVWLADKLIANVRLPVF